jgi:hypothetical protein
VPVKPWTDLPLPPDDHVRLIGFVIAGIAAVALAMWVMGARLADLVQRLNLRIPNGHDRNAIPKMILVVAPWVLAFGFFLSWRNASRSVKNLQDILQQSQTTMTWIASQGDACQTELQRARVGGLAQFLSQQEREDQQLEHERREQDTSDRLDALERRLDCQQTYRQFYDEKTISSLCR